MLHGKRGKIAHLEVHARGLLPKQFRSNRRPGNQGNQIEQRHHCKSITSQQLKNVAPADALPCRIAVVDRSFDGHFIPSLASAQ